MYIFESNHVTKSFYQFVIFCRMVVYRGVFIGILKVCGVGDFTRDCIKHSINNSCAYIHYILSDYGQERLAILEVQNLSKLS